MRWTAQVELTCICPCDHHCHEGSVYLHHSGQFPCPVRSSPLPMSRHCPAPCGPAKAPCKRNRTLLCLACFAQHNVSGVQPVAVGGSLPLPFYDWVERHRWPPVETVTDPCESPWPGRQPLDQESCEVTSLWVWAPTLTASHHGQGARKPHRGPSWASWWHWGRCTGLFSVQHPTT